VSAHQPTGPDAAASLSGVPDELPGVKPARAANPLRRLHRPSWADQEPTWADAKPGLIRAALNRAHELDSSQAEPLRGLWRLDLLSCRRGRLRRRLRLRATRAERGQAAKSGARSKHIPEPRRARRSAFPTGRMITCHRHGPSAQATSHLHKRKGARPPMLNRSGP